MVLQSSHLCCHHCCCQSPWPKLSCPPTPSWLGARRSACPFQTRKETCGFLMTRFFSFFLSRYRSRSPFFFTTANQECEQDLELSVLQLRCLNEVRCAEAAARSLLLKLSPQHLTDGIEIHTHTHTPHTHTHTTRRHTHDDRRTNGFAWSDCVGIYVDFDPHLTHRFVYALVSCVYEFVCVSIVTICSARAWNCMSFITAMYNTTMRPFRWYIYCLECNCFSNAHVVFWRSIVGALQYW